MSGAVEDARSLIAELRQLLAAVDVLIAIAATIDEVASRRRSVSTRKPHSGGHVVNEADRAVAVEAD